MHLLEKICCPRCKGALRDESSHLSCDACVTRYPLQGGVPLFVDLATLPEHLQGQIKYFEHEAITSTDEYIVEPWQKRYVERFLENIPTIEGKVIADCGTGSAYMAIELARRGGTVIATDLSLRSVMRLRRIVAQLGLTDRVVCVCSTAEELPFRSASVDILISNAVLEHLQNEEAAIAEINRVCVPKASLMVTVPLSYSYLNPFLIPLNYIHDKRIGHLRRYDDEAIQRKFKNWALGRTYYTGHTAKVVKTLINMLHPVFDAQQIENDDSRFESKKWFASNIICFLSRRAPC
jgi:ubiquinone/menaquinone biosynthesis C-methylase UbiE/uncharacterized protein YbaR (Trm112 family)